MLAPWPRPWRRPLGRLLLWCREGLRPCSMGRAQALIASTSTSGPPCTCRRRPLVAEELLCTLGQGTAATVDRGRHVLSRGQPTPAGLTPTCCALQEAQGRQRQCLAAQRAGWGSCVVCGQGRPLLNCLPGVSCFQVIHAVHTRLGPAMPLTLVSMRQTGHTSAAMPTTGLWPCEWGCGSS